jgi:hypothetical protein
MSVSLDPIDFDSIYNHSDYVSGFYPEKKSHIEFFDQQHNLQWQTDHDLKLHGTTSTNNPQKGMRSSCRPYYNDPKIQSVLFPDDKPQLTSFTGFNLRQDYQGGGMWDAYATQVSRTLDIDYLALKQVNVFVNGNYWGEYQMREIGDEEYIENNHPYANEDSIDLLRQNYNWSNGFNGITPLAGSDTGFFNALNSITTQLTPQTPGFRSYFENNFEKKSYFDYMIAENYVGNYDWMGINQGIINNTKLWRPQNGGKWRYILYDCDYSIGIQTPSLDVLNDLLNPVPLCFHGQIFSKLMQDTLYKYYFINRFADMMNTIYQPSIANLLVTAYHDSLLSAIPRHLARWGSSNLGQWESALNTYFIGNSLPRIIALRDQLQSHFSLNQQLNITFEVHPAGAGSVFLNTINPQTYPWSGIYFDGAPISFRAIANQNHLFDHWDSPQTGIYMTDSVYLNPTIPQTIHLYFSSTTSIASNEKSDLLTVSPNPFSEGFSIVNSGKKMAIKVFDTLGREMLSSELPPGKYYLETKSWMPGIYFLNNGTLVQKLVKN